jgi:hypothetical protein
MIRILVPAVVLALAAASPALAQGKGKGKGNPGRPDVETTSEDIVEGVAAGVLGGVLSREERSTIRRYFDQNRDRYRKVKPLPPGIRMKIARGGAMPPGIAKQVLPGGLRRQLPPRTDYDYRVAGTDVVLVETATEVIVDIIRDVLGRRR